MYTLDDFSDPASYNMDLLRQEVFAACERCVDINEVDGVGLRAYSDVEWEAGDEAAIQAILDAHSSGSETADQKAAREAETAERKQSKFSDGEETPIILYNPERSNKDGGRSSKIEVLGQTGTGKIHKLGYIEICHSGRRNDQKSKFRVVLNAGRDDNNPKSVVMEIDESGLADFGKGGVITKYSTNDVSNPPTKAELTSAFGRPEKLGSAFIGILNDNGADSNVWHCTVIGGEWFYSAQTKAV